MEGPILFWGYKEQESNLILPEHDDDDDDDDMCSSSWPRSEEISKTDLKKSSVSVWTGFVSFS